MAVNAGEFYTRKIIDNQLSGMIKTREPGIYSARLKIPVGILTSEALEAIAALARKYGRGEVYLTVRLGIEIPGISAEVFPQLRDELAAAGIALAACGTRMRSTVGCKGTVCPHGNIDTFALAWEIDKTHNDGATLPHKFKVGLAGCASSCSKPQLNDVGLVGVREPILEAESCVGCGACVKACHVKGVSLVDDLPVFDRKSCVTCGDCAKACPTGAIKAKKQGIDLYAGGRWGRIKQAGLRVARFLDEAEAVAAVGAIKKWYGDNGTKKERLGETIMRVGPERFLADVQAEIPVKKRTTLTRKTRAAFAPFR